MKNMNKEVIYAGGGLLVGVILTIAVQGFNSRDLNNKYEEHVQRSMHDMMSNHNSANTSMHDSMNMMTSSLKNKTGDEFDKAFISEMITHHQGAIDMANMALSNAKHQEIKELSQDIISAQTTEISKMKEWQSSWYK